MKKSLVLTFSIIIFSITSMLVIMLLQDQNIKIDKKVIDDLNKNYYDISFDFDKKVATVDGKRINFNELFNVSKRQAKKISKEDIKSYLDDSIGNVEYNNDKIKVTNPYSLKTLIVETTKEELLKNENIDSYDEIADNIYRVTYKTVYETKESYEKLQKNENVENVVTDVLVEISSYLYPLNTVSSNYAWGVESTGLLNYAAKQNYQNQSRNIKIAVLDTGVRTSHEVFKINSGNNKIDKTYSYNYVDSNYNISDDQGHGTMVAGLISEATSNNIKIIPVKVLSSSGKGTFSDILDAVNNLKGKVDIMNLSFGVKAKNVTDSFVEMSDKVFKNAYNAGTIVVCAAGNNGINAIEYPASSDYTIAVSSMNKNKNISSFSNYGSKIDFSAPGNKQLLPTYNSNSSYDYNSGTSFAAPLVSSALGLIKSENPTYSIEQTKNVLKSNSDDLGLTGKDDYYGYGSVNFNNHMFLNPIVLNSSVSNTWSNVSNNISIIALSGVSINRCAITSSNKTPTSWNSITSSTFVSIDKSINNNGIYYVWLKDKNGKMFKKNIEVKYVDKNNPVFVKQLRISKYYPTKANISITVNDQESGISKIKWYYKKNSDSKYKEVIDNYNSVKSNITRTYQFSNLKSNVSYYVYVEICDMANNCITSNRLEVSTNRYSISDSDISDEEDYIEDKSIDVYGEWVNKNGNTYYYVDGEMQKGIIEIDGEKYLLGVKSGILYIN